VPAVSFFLGTSYGLLEYKLDFYLNLRKLESLYTYIYQHTGLSEKRWHALMKVLTTRHYKKGEALLKLGEVCTSIFFISKGYCRAVYNHEGQELNTNFYFENELATNIRSLKQERGSEYVIQAEEDLDAVIFDKDKLYALFSTSAEIDSMGRMLMEGVLERQEERAKLFKLDTARDRYDYMCSIQPQVIERVPLEHIASYLGISQEALLNIYNSDLSK
jgi:CRP-like cAMP-binding protein